MSGGMGVVVPVANWLGTIRNWGGHAGSAATSATRTSVIRAKGGASARSRRPNSATGAGRPCTSRKTAPESLPTNPARPSSVAIRCTNGRKPTPCTTPVTVTRCRTWVSRVPGRNSRGVSVMSTGLRVRCRVGAAPAHQLQPGHGLFGPGLIRLLDDEAHVDDHPVTGRERLVGQHADVDLALLTGDVDERELSLETVQHSDHLPRYAQTHGSAPLFGDRRCGVQRRDDLFHSPRRPRD